MSQSRRKFSTKSLTLLANNATTHLPPHTLDTFLATLSAIDEQIHSELTRTREQLSDTTTELDKERALRQAAEKRLATASTSSTSANLVNTDPARLRDATPAALIDLLLAREHAFRQQSALVDRLKAHNAQLRTAYQALSKRVTETSAKEPPTHSDRLDTARADSPVSQPSRQDDPHRSCRPDSCDAAAAGLLRTIAIQQRAHEKLRATVAELTNELERIDPHKVPTTNRSEETLRATEQRLTAAEAEITEKDVEILELKKQLKKVLAEYEAVSVAHSYSNAELSKIRANCRGKGKQDRPTADRLHAFGTGVENLLHQRKIHFR